MERAFAARECGAEPDLAMTLSRARLLYDAGHFEGSDAGADASWRKPPRE
jgi:hypothetical protein